MIDRADDAVAAGRQDSGDNQQQNRESHIAVLARAIGMGIFRV
jgi:hypothetical protein